MVASGRQILSLNMSPALLVSNAVLRTAVVMFEMHHQERTCRPRGLRRRSRETQDVLVSSLSREHRQMRRICQHAHAGRRAEAQTKINEAYAGISSELGDVGLAVSRAEDKTAQMQARASAIDELVASGALEDTTGLGKDKITAELEAMASEQDVNAQLEAMKRELGAGGKPEAIGG